MPTSTSNSNSNSNSNPNNSRNNSSNVSPSRSPFGGAVLHVNTSVETQTPYQRSDGGQGPGPARGYDSLRGRASQTTDRERFRPSTPSVVYIVTSNFTSQTMTDGVRLSESDIVGFQILAVFAKLEEANSYAENECEEIDAGVRLRRTRTSRGGAVGGLDGDGIRVNATIRDDGTVSWNVEGLGLIEVESWTVQ